MGGRNFSLTPVSDPAYVSRMSLYHDLRFALRLMVKERWFTGVAVAALALGIGVNATVFTLVNAVLIKGPALQGLGAALHAGPEAARGPGNERPLDAGAAGLRSQSQTFAGLAGFSGSNFNLADERGFPERQNGSNLTANAFRVLGRPAPLLGRDFVDGEDKRGAERVVILGYTLWKNRYASIRTSSAARSASTASRRRSSASCPTT